MATLLSLFITFCFGLKITNSMAEEDLNNEGSVFFQSFMGYMKKARSNYAIEKQ